MKNSNHKQLLPTSTLAIKQLKISDPTRWALTDPRGSIQSVRVGHGSRKMVLYPVHNLQIWLLEQSKEKGGNRNA